MREGEAEEKSVADVGVVCRDHRACAQSRFAAHDSDAIPGGVVCKRYDEKSGGEEDHRRSRSSVDEVTQVNAAKSTERANQDR